MAMSQWLVVFRLLLLSFVFGFNFYSEMDGIWVLYNKTRALFDTVTLSRDRYRIISKFIVALPCRGGVDPSSKNQPHIVTFKNWMSS